MKNGHLQKLVNEYMVELTEDDKTVSVIYMSDEQQAKQLLENWKNGTHKLLLES